MPRIEHLSSINGGFVEVLYLPIKETLGSPLPLNLAPCGRSDPPAVTVFSVCPNLSFPHAISGNPLLISSRFRLKDCRNDKNRGISGQTLFVYKGILRHGRKRLTKLRDRTPEPI